MSEIEFLGEEEFKSLLAREGSPYMQEERLARLQRSVERGDTVLVYRKDDPADPNVMAVSYGGPAADISMEDYLDFPDPMPALRMPGIADAAFLDRMAEVNRRYRLIAAYRGQTTDDETITEFLSQGGLDDE